MKIIINAVSAKLGGSVSYISNLLRSLPTVKDNFQFLVFLPAETAAKLGGLGQNIQILPTGISHAGMLKRMWWEQVTLRRLIKKEHADVLFSTANFGMFRCPVRQILLVRNSLYFSKSYRERFLPRHSLRFRMEFGLRRWLICRSAKSADMVMTPTQAMLDELRRFVEVEPGRSLVNHYGVVHPQTVGHAGGALGGFESKNECVVGLLYVSFYAEHKNLNTLLKALPLLNREGGQKYMLKTTADPGWEASRCTVTYQEDLTLARKPGVARWVEFVGPLDRRAMEELYQKCDIFVFPAITESFGHPLVEAMTQGLPIVAADTPVNREVCGDAAVYFAPFDPQSLEAKVRLVSRDASARDRMARAARKRAAEAFRWDNHVRLVLEWCEASLNVKPSNVNDKVPSHA